MLENPHSSPAWLPSLSFVRLAAGMTPALGGDGAGSRDGLEERPFAIIVATPFFMGIASVKFKIGDMEAMGKNLGGAVCLFLEPIRNASAHSTRLIRLSPRLPGPPAPPCPKRRTPNSTGRTIDN